MYIQSQACMTLHNSFLHMNRFNKTKSVVLCLIKLKRSKLFPLTVDPFFTREPNFWQGLLPLKVCLFPLNVYLLFFHIPTKNVYMSRNGKSTSWHVRPTKTQISLRIHEVWSESSLSAWRHFVTLTIQNEPSEDSDQTAQMRSLIWIFAGHICPNVRFLTLRFKCFCFPFPHIPTTNMHNLFLPCVGSASSEYTQRPPWHHCNINRGSYTSGNFIRNFWNDHSASFIKFHMKWPRV